MNLSDELMKRVKALPAANATAVTDVLDLNAPNVTGGTQMQIQVRISVPALPNLADTKTFTVTMTDCDTSGGSYTAVANVPVLTMTGVSTSGAAAKTLNYMLPPGVRQFVKWAGAVQAAGGDNTAVSFTVQIVG
jgi:hypothetical protein